MDSYGVRLFTFNINLRRSRTVHPLVKSTDNGTTWSYRDHILTAMSSRLGARAYGLPPRLDGQPRNASPHGDPVLELRSVKQIGDHLFGELRYGRPAGHDWAVPTARNAQQPPLDLTEYAPTRTYRFGLLFPTVGNDGVLAVESVSGACPSKQLVNWARYWSQEDAAAKSTPDDWYKLNAYALTDPQQVKNFLQSGNVQELVLVKKTVGASRMTRREEFRVTSRLDPAGKQRSLKKLEGILLNQKNDADLADELSQELGAGVAALGLDDAWLVIDTDKGKKQISPSRLPEIFTYPISSTRPSDQDIRDETKRQIRRIASVAHATIGFTGW